MKIPKVKHREHYVLFCKDTPFKPSRVLSKIRYRRHEKHKSTKGESSW